MFKKIKYNSPVVLTFAALSLASLIIGGITNGISTQMFFCVYRSPLDNILTYPRFIMHVLGHSDLNHYIGNMLLFLVIGPQLEDRFGSLSLLSVIIATAAIAGIVQFVFFPGTALLGASGIVFMMIIMSTFLVYEHGTLPLTMVLIFILYIGGEIAKGIMRDDNISQLSHIMGGICGGFFGYILTSKRRR